MKPLIFTFHAPARMAQREIAAEWIERPVRDPGWTEPDPKDPQAERRYRHIFERARSRVARRWWWRRRTPFAL